MIGLLNLLPALFILGGLWLAFMKKSWKIGVVSVALLIICSQFQPSYMPKGEVAKQALPAFESRGTIKNEILKPMDSDKREERLNSQLREVDKRLKGETL